MKRIKNIVAFSCLTFFVTPPMRSMGNFNFDSMQNLQQELEEANRAIEEYISSLPADEQAEFNRAVDEVSQMFDNMSEDEFAAFLNEMFTEESMMGAPTETYAPSYQPTPVQETPALTSEQKKKVDNIITVINDVIRQSNVFLVQINSSLEASKNINNWAKKGTITYWQPSAQWQDLKSDIEKFIQKLYQLEDKDLSTQEYKYIVDLIADEATLNNLIQLQTNLNVSVPQIEISELDIKALSSQAKETIKNTLQYYTEALYVLQLPKTIDSIFEKYAPKAEKLLQAEEAAEKRAAEAAKRPRSPIGASTAGVTAEGGYGYEQSYGGYDYGSYGGGYGGGYGDYYGSGYGGGGDYGSYGGSEEGFSGEGRQKGSGGGGGGGMGMGGGGRVPEEAGTTEQKNIPTSTGATIQPTKNPVIKELINTIQENAKEVAKIIKDNTLFSTLETHIKGKEDTDSVNTDLANAIVEVNEKLKSLDPEIQSLQSMISKTNQVTQTYYNTRLKTVLKKPLEIIANLKTELDKIEFDKIEKKQIKITPEKQWAYFAGDDKLLKAVITEEATGTEASQGLKDKVKKRVSLKELYETIKVFESTIKTLKEKTAQSTTVTTVIPAVPTPPTIAPINPTRK